MLAGIKKALAECNSQIVDDLKQPQQEGQNEEPAQEQSEGDKEDTTTQQPTVTIQE